MVPINNRFLINEIVPMWSRRSIGNTIRQTIKTVRPNPTATEKVKNIEAAQNNIPSPKPVNLGMKPFRRPPTNSA